MPRLPWVGAGAGGRLGGLLGAGVPARFAWPVRLSLEAGQGLAGGVGAVALRELRASDQAEWSALQPLLPKY